MAQVLGFTPDDDYRTDEASGEGWQLLLGDSCERLRELEDDSVDFSICSPPFAQVYNYSPSPRDLSNSSSREEFFEHYAFIIREQFRVTKPGRVAIIHVADITVQKVLDGFIGVSDFSSQVVKAFQDEGWIFDGRWTIDKNPQAQAIRTKSQSLLFVTMDRDSTMLRPAMPDYALKFRKPGDNAVPVKARLTKEEWIKYASPVWLDINETNTLNVRVAKDDADERHICPLQLDFIDVFVRMYVNPGETVLTPFAGIGSETFVALKNDCKTIGIELKESFWLTAVANMRRLELDRSTVSIFDTVEGYEGIA